MTWFDSFTTNVNSFLETLDEQAATLATPENQSPREGNGNGDINSFGAPTSTPTSDTPRDHPSVWSFSDGTDHSAVNGNILPSSDNKTLGTQQPFGSPQDPNTSIMTGTPSQPNHLFQDQVDPPSQFTASPLSVPVETVSDGEHSKPQVHTPSAFDDSDNDEIDTFENFSASHDGKIETFETQPPTTPIINNDSTTGNTPSNIFGFGNDSTSQTSPPSELSQTELAAEEPSSLDFADNFLSFGTPLVSSTTPSFTPENIDTETSDPDFEVFQGDDPNDHDIEPATDSSVDPLPDPRVLKDSSMGTSLNVKMPKTETLLPENVSDGSGSQQTEIQPPDTSYDEKIPETEPVPQSENPTFSHREDNQEPAPATDTVSSSYISTLENQIQVLRQQFTQSQKNNGSLDIEIRSLREEESAYRNQIKQLFQEINTYRQKIDARNESIGSLSDQLGKAETNIQGYTQRISELEKNQKPMSDRIHSQLEEITGLTLELEHLRGEKQTFTAEKKRLLDKMQTLETDSAEESSELGKIQKELLNYKKDIQNLQAENARLIQEATSLSENLHSYRTRAQEALENAQNAALTSNQGDTTTDSESDTKTIKSLREQLSTVQTSLTSLQSKYDYQVTTISQLNKQLEMDSNMYANAASRFNKIKSQMETKIINLNSQISTIQSERQQEKESFDSTLKNSNDRFQKLSLNHTKLQTLYNNLSTKALSDEATSDRLSKLESENISLRKKISSMSSESSSIQIRETLDIEPSFEVSDAPVKRRVHGSGGKGSYGTDSSSSTFVDPETSLGESEEDRQSSLSSNKGVFRPLSSSLGRLKISPGDSEQIAGIKISISELLESSDTSYSNFTSWLDITPNARISLFIYLILVHFWIVFLVLFPAKC